MIYWQGSRRLYQSIISFFFLINHEKRKFMSCKWNDHTHCIEICQIPATKNPHNYLTKAPQSPRTFRFSGMYDCIWRLLHDSRKDRYKLISHEQNKLFLFVQQRYRISATAHEAYCNCLVIWSDLCLFAQD